MFTFDGYINNQALTASIPYGRMRSSENGCGWIAAYNTLHRLGATPVSPESVADCLRGGLILWGYLGTWPFSIVRFLRRRGYSVSWSLRRARYKEFLRKSVASILLYIGPFWKSQHFHLHYVMLYPEGDRVRILNLGGDNYWESIEALDSLLPRGMLTLLISVSFQK